MTSPTQKSKPNESDPPEARAVFAVFAQALAPYLARALKDELRAGKDPAWLDQHASALGNRRHCSAARRRITEGAGGAEHIGRRWLLTPAAIDEELARSRLRRAAPDKDVRQLADELGLRLVAGGKRYDAHTPDAASAKGVGTQPPRTQHRERARGSK